MLTTVFEAIGALGSWGVTTKLLNVPSTEFIDEVIYYVDFDDFYIGILKAAVFGLIMAVIGCYQGYYTTRGAEGVGKATTQSVVLSSVTVMVANYFLTALMF